MSDLEDACNQVGAVKCEFEPDEDECETCDRPYQQLYYIRTCYETDEGEYHCADCIKKMPEKIQAESDALVLAMQKDGLIPADYNQGGDV